MTRPAGPRLPILAYHALGEADSPIWKPVEAFEAEMAALAGAGYRAVGLGGLVDRLRRGEPLPDEVFALTFDDGYASVHREALPRLADRGWPATVFLVTSRCGGTNRWPGQPPTVPEAPLLGWEEAGELIEAGWELGGHGVAHLPLTVVSTAAVEAEIAGSLEAIERETGFPARLFAYPYGAVDARVRAVAARLAAAAVGVRPGLAGPGSDLHDLERVDAHYLSPARAARLDRPLSRARFRARGWLRRARRAFAHDWDAGFRPSM